MSRPLIILGTGGNALDFLDVVEAINRASPTWDLVGFLDDGRPAGSEFHGVEILGPVSAGDRVPPLLVRERDRQRQELPPAGRDRGRDGTE